jgi:hypothetical protein
MNFEEFVRKTDEIRNLSRGTTDEEIKKRLKNEFFDVVIDYFNENFTGDYVHADGSVSFVGAIEPEPRRIYTSYNETPTMIGPIMSANISNTPETPKTSNRFVEKLNSLKPSNQSDEARETFRRRAKLTLAFGAGVLATVTAVATASYYSAIAETPDVEDVEETDETTED